MFFKKLKISSDTCGNSWSNGEPEYLVEQKEESKAEKQKTFTMDTVPVKPQHPKNRIVCSYCEQEKCHCRSFFVGVCGIAILILLAGFAGWIAIFAGIGYNSIS